MLTIFAFIFLLIFSIVIFIPLIWVLCGKVFKIDNLTFKKALVTCLIISLVGVIFELIIPLLNLLGINNIFIYFFTTLTCLIITIWIIKKKFNTTVFRSIGVYLSSIICAVGLALFIRTYVVQMINNIGGNPIPDTFNGKKLSPPQKRNAQDIKNAQGEALTEVLKFIDNHIHNK